MFFLSLCKIIQFDSPFAKTCIVVHDVISLR